MPHLAAGEAGVSVKDLGWLTVPLHGPVVDRGLRHQGDHVLGDPLPEDDVVSHRVGLHLGLHLNMDQITTGLFTNDVIITSMLKICKVFWAFKAITLLAGFMIALSALMGLLMGLVGSLMSMMTTWAKENI